MKANAPLKREFSGSIWELIRLLFPLALTALTSYFVCFVEKLFLVRSSLDFLEASVSVTYVSRLFQYPCISLAMMAQAFVGRLQGGQEEAKIGSTIWQFIWFSFASLFITMPLGLAYGDVYFQDTRLESTVQRYFESLMAMNFLYPLGVSLACFYLGQGKTHLVLIAKLLTASLNIALAYLLIFGVEGWIPAFGLMGSPIATLIAEGGYCIGLFACFMAPHHARQYGTRNYAFRPKLFYECLSPAFFRALSRLSVFFCWASISHLLLERGNDYLLVWSIGSTLTMLLPFVLDGVCQATTIVASNLLGANSTHFLTKLRRSAVVIVLTIACGAAVPMLLWPLQTFEALFPGVELTEESVRWIFSGVWLCFILAMGSAIPIGFMLAFKDTKFLLITAFGIWLNAYATIYLALDVFEMPPQFSWLILSLTNLMDLVWYSYRVRFLMHTSLSSQPSPQNGLLPLSHG